MRCVHRSPRPLVCAWRASKRFEPRVLASATETLPPTKPVVFVAGATGRTGIRVCRELLAAGYTVRAGVRDVSKAEAIFAGRASPAGVGYTGAKEAPPAALVGLIPVACDETLLAAIGGAEVVVSCLGAPESEALNPSLPRAIDGDGATSLVEAAKASGTVQHFLMVSSLGTGKFGWPASVLNLFWNVLEHKARAEAALRRSGIAFTIIRPGGMERPTDDYDLTHGTVLKAADSTFGGNVSRKQVAALVGAAIAHPEASANKARARPLVVEVIASEGVPLRPLDRQLAALPAVPTGALSSRYAFRKDPLARLLEVMGFGGAAPELINGRVAMLAVVGIAWAELHGSGTVWEQVGTAGASAPAELIVASVIAASAPPLAKGVRPADARVGPFSAFAETLHGRIAMLALVAIAGLEFVHGIPVATHPSPFY